MTYLKKLIAALACIIVLVNCSQPDIEVQPTDSYDTLGIKWMKIERNNIIYYFQGTGVKGASLYTDLHEAAYDKLSATFSPQLPRKLRFFVWTDANIAQQKLGRQLGYAVPTECVCYVRASQTLGHEMTHVQSYWANGTKQETYSRLVSEGVAVAFDLAGDDKMKTAKKASSGKNINSVADLWTDDGNRMPEEVFYPVAGAFMEFLYKKNMNDKFFALIKNQRRDEAEQIYGKEQLDALIQEFDSQVGF